MQENRELYVKTRDAFRKAWFSLPTNKPCSYYTRDVLGEALAASREIESNKVKAASVMVHVLDFANWAEPKFNPKPDFTWQDLMEYTKGPLRKTEAPLQTLQIHSQLLYIIGNVFQLRPGHRLVLRIFHYYDAALGLLQCACQIAFGPIQNRSPPLDRKAGTQSLLFVLCLIRIPLTSISY